MVIQHHSTLLLSHQVDEQVAYLLEENNDSGGSIVVVRVAPDETDGVEDGSKTRSHVREFQLIQAFHLVDQWLQVAVDILGLCQS